MEHIVSYPFWDGRKIMGDICFLEFYVEIMLKSWCGIVVRFGSSTIGAATSHWLVGETRVLSPEEDAVVTCVVLYRCIRMISSCCWSFRKKTYFESWECQRQCLCKILFALGHEHEVFFWCVGDISSGGISIRVQEQALVQKLRHEGLDVAPDGVMLLRKRGGNEMGMGSWYPMDLWYRWSGGTSSHTI